MKKNKIILALSSLFMLAGCGQVSEIKAGDNSETWGKINLKDEYNRNDSLYLDNVSFSIDGETVMSSPTLIFPSGKKTDSQNNILNETGEYTVVYSAIVNNKLYEKETNFFVKTPYHYFETNLSSSYYGVGEKATHEGLVVNLAKNDTMYFNEVIDLTEITTSDTLIKIYMNPINAGTHDLNNLNFRFTDIEDESNYLEIYLGRYLWMPESNPGWGVVMGKGDDTDRVGAESWTNGLPNAGSNRGQVQANSQFGAIVNLSFDGNRKLNSHITYGYRDEEETDYGYVSTETATISTLDYDATEALIVYDYKTMELGVISMKLDFKGSRITETEYHKVWDFDDPRLADKVVGGTGSWRGFTSGKCRLSITGNQYEGSSARFVLTDIYGYDLKKEILPDEVAPVIEIKDSNVKGGNAIISGKVDCYYPIPNAVGKDFYCGPLPVTSAVYYNYGTPSQVTVDSYNGKFYPKRSGNYVIEYKCHDFNGNEATEVVNVKIGDKSSSDIVLSPFGDIQKTTYQGQYYQLPKMSTSGGKGDLLISATAKHGSKKINIQNNKFIPESSGDWSITIKCTDFIGQENTYEYTLNVLENTKAFLLENPVFPMYYISYGRYQVPNTVAFKYINNEKVEIRPDVKVEFNYLNSSNENEKFEDILKPGDNFATKNIINGENIKFTYSYDGETIFEKEIPALNPIYFEDDMRRVDFKKYFVSDDIKSISYNLDDLKMTGYRFTSNGSDMSIDFANPLLADGFSLDLYLKENQEINEIKVRLTDVENLDHSISIELEKNTNNSFTVKSGEFTKDTSATTLNNETNLVSINFNGSDFVIGTNDVKASVARFDNGDEFAPFASHKVYLNFEVNGLPNDSYFVLNRIGNHQFKSSTEEVDNDFVAPQYFVEGSHGQYGQINEKSSTEVIYVQDVFSPSSECFVTIEDQNGNKVVNEDGQEIDYLDASKSYSFIFNKTEIYTASYEVQELYKGSEYWLKRNNDGEECYYGVLDTTKPIITITSTMYSSTKVGWTLSLMTFEVSDNITKTEDLYILKEMILPCGRTQEIGDGIEKYQFNEAGLFEYRIVVMDEAMNVTMFSLFIYVYEN